MINISSQEREISVPICSRSAFPRSCIKFAFPRVRVPGTRERGNAKPGMRAHLWIYILWFRHLVELSNGTPIQICYFKEMYWFNVVNVVNDVKFLQNLFKLKWRQRKLIFRHDFFILFLKFYFYYYYFLDFYIIFILFFFSVEKIK